MTTTCFFPDCYQVYIHIDIFILKSNYNRSYNFFFFSLWKEAYCPKRECKSLADNTNLKINGFEEIQQKEGSLGNQQAVERTVIKIWKAAVFSFMAAPIQKGHDGIEDEGLSFMISSNFK